MLRTPVRYAALAALPVLLLVQQGAGATQAPRLTQNVQATKEDVDPARTYSAPYLAVDPSNNLHIVGSFIDFRSGRCGLIRSLDGGQTWKRLDASPAPATFPFCESTMSGNGIYHAPIAFGRDGTLYYAVMGWDAGDGGGKLDTSVILARSKNLGDSWDTTLVRNNRGKVDLDVENIRPMTGIAVDTKSGSQDIVYVSYSLRKPNAVAPNAEPNEPAVQVSTDGGRTFGDPINAVDGAFASPAVRSDAFSKVTTTLPPPGPTTTTTAPPAGSRADQPDQQANFGGGKSYMAVDDKGTVYVAWPSATANIANPPPPGYFLSKSTDHGKTWTITQIAPFDYANKAGAPGPNASLQLAWSPKGGAQGTLHVVAEGNDRTDIANLSHIWYFRSTDGGKTWDKPKVIDDDDKSQMVGQFMPTIRVAPNGRVDVAWWDTRDVPAPGTPTNDVYYTYSTDNGDTFSKNIRISDQSISRRYGVFLNNFNMAAPPGLASTNAYAVFGWDDTRLTDPNFADNQATGGGVQDIFTSMAQFQTIAGGTSKAVKVVLAGVIGLLAVAVVLLFAGLAWRRRQGPPAGEDRASAGTPGSFAGAGRG